MNYHCPRPPRQPAFDTSLLMWRRRLLGGAAPDAYAVGGANPEFVADFAGVLNSGTEYYRSGGSDTTFSSVFTHSGLEAPATMTYSDGDLKWAPHNFIDNSQNFSSWDLIANRGSVTSNTVTAPDGTTTADTFTEGTASSTSHFVGNTCGTGVGAIIPVGGRVRISVFAKAGDRSHIALGMTSSTYASDWAEADQAYFDLSNGTKGYDENGSGTIVSVGDGWYLCSVDFTPANNAVYPAVFLATGTSNGNNIFSGDPATYPSGVYLWGAHSYRIDLGGMVNNPDRGDSYVPTTTAARYLPRRNHYLYNGSTYDKAGILIESADATNLATYSNDFTNAAWSTNAANETLTAAASTGPDGATSMTRLNDDSGTGTGEVYVDQAVTVATSTAYTFSVYAKSDQLSWIALGAENFTTPANGESFFNLSAGTVGTAATGHTARIENVASGIYRCSITFTTDASDTSGNIRIYVADADTDITVDRDGTSSVYIYGAQFEAGSVPTSYIPVVAGSTVTRAAETLTVAGANLPYSATAMSFHVSGKMTYADLGLTEQFGLYFWGPDTTTNYITAYIRTDSTRTGMPVFITRSAATGADAVEGGLTAFSPGVNVPFNVAHRLDYNANLQNGAVAGAALTESTVAIDVGTGISSSNFVFHDSGRYAGRGLMGSIGVFRMWGTDIGDSGIETAST